MDTLQKLLSELPKGYEIKTIDGSNVGLLPQLFAVHGDTLFAWTGKSLVTATGIKTANATNLTFNKLSDLNLTCIPFGRVLRLEMNRCGSNLALVCSDYCYVVEIPKEFWFFRSKTEIKDEYLCKCIQLDASSHESNANYLRVRWHSGSPNDRHLVTLKTDNVLRIYNVDSAKNTMPVQCIILSRIDSFASVSPRAQDLLSSIGESAVSFDFGPRVNVPLISKEPLYPIFILYGNGDVYNVLTDLSHLRQFPVCGPLTITPPAEDNYGVDSCDLLVLSSSKSPNAVTVLVIATSYGNLYHAVVFVEETQSVDDEIGVSFSLHVYESVELEFSLSTLDLITKELKEDSCASPVCLYKDDFAPDIYYCQHSAGLHIIRLPWIRDFEYFNSLNSSDAAPETEGISESSCLVDYRLCTCPKPSDKFTPICGLATVFQNSTDSILITLLPDFELHASLLSNDPFLTNIGTFSAKADQISGNEEKIRTSQKRPSFLDHVKNELKRNSTIPLLKAPNKEISEKEAAEILLRSVSLLKTEYIDKLINAQQICIERSENSAMLWRKQKLEIEKLLKFLNKVSARHGEVVKRFQKISQIQHKNVERLDYINENLAEKCHSLSSAEENMLREMQKLKSKIDMSLEKLKQLEQSTSKYCQKLVQNAPCKSVLPNTAETELQKIIQNQSQQIEWLMDNIKRLNDI